MFRAISRRFRLVSTRRGPVTLFWSLPGLTKKTSISMASELPSKAPTALQLRLLMEDRLLLLRRSQLGRRRDRFSRASQSRTATPLSIHNMMEAGSISTAHRQVSKATSFRTIRRAMGAGESRLNLVRLILVETRSVITCSWAVQAELAVRELRLGVQ